jgi:hypothetical protein
MKKSLVLCRGSGVGFDERRAPRKGNDRAAQENIERKN